ncbi:hypothetical protein SCHPADRAFT_891020 [Schizopora paradoxa]|uniref:Uncharacterized protein n=1 Tax=Schizopora paradoxa TaxID=27342 RepID=A0A0H2S5C3_9AGAM|nr:hypothetical protein SCHPADRAFT_891020 [Schizopora paradoxa]
MLDNAKFSNSDGTACEIFYNCVTVTQIEGGWVTQPGCQRELSLDPDSSFIAARYITDIYGRITPFLSWGVLDEFIRNSRDLKDFFKKVLDVKVTKFRTNGPDDNESGEPFSYVEGEIKGINTIIFPTVENFAMLRRLLKTLTGSDGYLSHLSYIRSRDGQTQKAMKDIFDEILVIFMYIWKHIETEGLSGQEYECLIMDEEHHENPTQGSNSNADHNLNRFGHAITLLDIYCSVNQGKLEDRALATFFKKIISSIQEDLHTGCIDRADTTLLSPQMVTTVMHTELESPFNSTSHSRILAFYDNSGMPFYLASVRNPNAAWGMPYFFTSVKDGDTVATWYDEHGRANTTSNFMVLVLRHDPIDFPTGHNYNPWRNLRPRAGSLDPTGPIYWLQYFPKKEEDFFEDIDQEILCDIDLLISSQVGGITPKKETQTQNIKPWSHMGNHDIVESDLSDDALEMVEFSSNDCSSHNEYERHDDDVEPVVIGIRLESVSNPDKYSREADSYSPQDRALHPRARRPSDASNGQSPPDLREDSDIPGDIVEGEGRSREVQDDVDAGPVSGEDMIDRLRRTIEEKEKEIAILRSMLSQNNNAF